MTIELKEAKTKSEIKKHKIYRNYANCAMMKPYRRAY